MMLSRILSLLFLLFLNSCKDKPYEEKVEVIAEQEKEHAFSGITEIGAPVSGASITAYEFSSLAKGKKIGESITGRDGAYALSLKTNYEGPILLVATGGLYRDLVTGEVIALKPEQELRSAITHIKMPEQTNINAWTTMAVSRVLADRGFWDNKVAGLADIDRINTDFAHISYFLTGKSKNFVNIRKLEPWDLEKEAFKPEDPKAVLAHGSWRLKSTGEGL